MKRFLFCFLGVFSALFLMAESWHTTIEFLCPPAQNVLPANAKNSNILLVNNCPIQPANQGHKIIVLGLLIWLAGLFLCMLCPKQPFVTAAALALCFLGAAACCHALAGLTEDMRRAAAFALGHTPENMNALLETNLRFSALAGGIIGLASLALTALFPAALSFSVQSQPLAGLHHIAIRDLTHGFKQIDLPVHPALPPFSVPSDYNTRT